MNHKFTIIGLELITITVLELTTNLTNIKPRLFLSIKNKYILIIF